MRSSTDRFALRMMTGRLIFRLRSSSMIERPSRPGSMMSTIAASKESVRARCRPPSPSGSCSTAKPASFSPFPTKEAILRSSSISRIRIASTPSAFQKHNERAAPALVPGGRAEFGDHPLPRFPEPFRNRAREHRALGRIYSFSGDDEHGLPPAGIGPRNEILQFGQGLILEIAVQVEFLADSDRPPFELLHPAGHRYPSGRGFFRFTGTR